MRQYRQLIMNTGGPRAPNILDALYDHIRDNCSVREDDNGLFYFVVVLVMPQIAPSKVQRTRSERCVQRAGVQPLPAGRFSTSLTETCLSFALRRKW